MHPSGNQQPAYERKFARFIDLLRHTPEELVIVHHPEVLGDTYDELVESLNRLSEARKKLAILPHSERG